METKTYLKRALIFIIIGMVIYLGFYVVAERLVYSSTERNRFFLIKSAPPSSYDVVILGASHAMALDFEDMTSKLEEMTGKKIINLSTLGSGIVPNRLFFDYFLTRHQTKAVIYFADAGVFMKEGRNEGRFDDVSLFNRAPFDFALLKLLWGYYSQDLMEVNTVVNYALGFSKVSNNHRFRTDINDLERNFGKRYRPNEKQIKARIASTDPATIDEELFDRYMSEFAEMIDDLQARGIKVLVCRPPLPKMYLDNKLNEEVFDTRVLEILDKRQALFQDFSKTVPDYEFYFDTDHLNRKGVAIFFENHLKQFIVDNVP